MLSSKKTTWFIVAEHLDVFLEQKKGYELQRGPKKSKNNFEMAEKKKYISGKIEIKVMKYPQKMKIGKYPM